MLESGSDVGPFGRSAENRPSIQNVMINGVGAIFRGEKRPVATRHRFRAING
jgi:hypothetical protein